MTATVNNLHPDERDERGDYGIERHIICGLTVSAAFVKRVKSFWSDDVIESPELRRVARWCLDHFEKYGRVIGDKLDALYLDRANAEQIPKPECELIERALQIISNEYGAGEKFDADFVYDRTVAFFEKRKAEQLIEAIDNLAGDGKFGEVLDLAGGFARPSFGAPAERLPDPWENEPPPPEFDLGILPKLLALYVEGQAQAKGIEPGPVAWSAIAACAAALDGSLRLQMKRSDPSFRVPPGIWILLAGEVSALKSPTLEAGFLPLVNIQSEWAEKHAREREEWRREDPDERGPEPQFRQLYTHNGTIEGIRDMLAVQDRGVTVLNDEWAEFIGNLGRYSGGKNAGSADRAFYNTAYSGTSYVANRSDRKAGGDRIFVKNLQVNVVGGVQPDVLRAFNRNHELEADGMLQRSCTILLGKPGIDTDRDVVGLSQRYERLIRRLVEVPGNRTILMSPEAEIVRRRVSERVREYAQLTNLGKGFVGACGKLYGTWGRLALTLAHVLARGEVGEVDMAAAELAERLVFDSLVRNLALFYQMLGGGGDVETTRQIASLVLRRRLSRVTASDVVQNTKAVPDRRTDGVRAALSPLIAMGWLTPEERQDERTARAWKVNPLVHVQFDERAREEKVRAEKARDLIASSSRARKQEWQDQGGDFADFACARDTESCEGKSPDDSGPDPEPTPRARKQTWQSGERPDHRDPDAFARASKNGKPGGWFRGRVHRTAMNDRVMQRHEEENRDG